MVDDGERHTERNIATKESIHTWPAVEEHDGDGILVRGEDAGKVNGVGAAVVVSDGDFILGEGVDVSFGLAPVREALEVDELSRFIGPDSPVELSLPVLLCLGEPSVADAEFPVVAQVLVGAWAESGEGEELLHVVELLLGDLDLEARRLEQGIPGDVVVVGSQLAVDAGSAHIGDGDATRERLALLRVIKDGWMDR